MLRERAVTSLSILPEQQSAMFHEVLIGIAILQALLAGIGLLIAGVPAAGLLSFLVLLLGILQIGPSLILIPLIFWSWFRMDTAMAVLFTLYLVPVNLLDNLLRPLVAQGAEYTDASDTNRRGRRHSRAWHYWSFCGPNRTFDRLAIARRLDNQQTKNGSGCSCQPEARLTNDLSSIRMQPAASKLAKSFDRSASDMSFSRYSS